MFLSLVIIKLIERVVWQCRRQRHRLERHPNSRKTGGSSLRWTQYPTLASGPGRANVPPPTSSWSTRETYPSCSRSRQPSQTGTWYGLVKAWSGRTTRLRCKCFSRSSWIALMRMRRLQLISFWFSSHQRQPESVLALLMVVSSCNNWSMRGPRLTEKRNMSSAYVLQKERMPLGPTLTPRSKAQEPHSHKSRSLRVPTPLQPLLLVMPSSSRSATAWNKSTRRSSKRNWKRTWRWRS